MASTFPSILTSYTNPLATDRLNNPSHSGIETNQHSGLTALETFVGTLSSVQGTLMYDIRASASNGGGHVQTANKGGTGQTVFTKGDVLVGQSSSVLSKLSVGADSSALIADSTQSLGIRWGSPGKFGGTGADGALSITSGTTTIDCANATIVTKNYTSISITGTANLAFSNPHANGTIIILKSQGGITVTSSTVPAIDASGMGAASNSYGNNNFGSRINYGANGQSDGTPQTNAVGGASLSASAIFVINPMVLLACGAGGGTAGTSTGSNFTSSGGGGGSLINSGTNGTSANHAAGTGGVGGRGGGALYFECAGAWNITSTITVAGLIGITGTGSNGDGGGGGGGGTIVSRYASLTADSGTYTVTGGAAGPKVGTGNIGGVGGSGQSSISLNTFIT